MRKLQVQNREQSQTPKSNGNDDRLIIKYSKSSKLRANENKVLKFWENRTFIKK